MLLSWTCGLITQQVLAKVAKSSIWKFYKVLFAVSTEKILILKLTALAADINLTIVSLQRNITLLLTESVTIITCLHCYIADSGGFYITQKRQNLLICKNMSL